MHIFKCRNFTCSYIFLIILLSYLKHSISILFFGNILIEMVMTDYPVFDKSIFFMCSQVDNQTLICMGIMKAYLYVCACCVQWKADSTCDLHIFSSSPLSPIRRGKKQRLTEQQLGSLLSSGKQKKCFGEVGKCLNLTTSEQVAVRIFTTEESRIIKREVYQ